MKSKLSLLLIISMLNVGTVFSQDCMDKPGSFGQVGAIKLEDPMSVVTGYRQAGDDVFEFTLDDVGKSAGHVRAVVASGFMLTKQVLEELYPGDELPVRGQISNNQNPNWADNRFS